MRGFTMNKGTISKKYATVVLGLIVTLLAFKRIHDGRGPFKKTTLDRQQSNRVLIDHSVIPFDSANLSSEIFFHPLN